MIIVALIFSILNLQPIDAGNLSQIQQLSDITIVSGVNDIEFHPNEPTQLAIAHESGDISIWDVSNGQNALKRWAVSEHAIKKIEFLPDGQHIVYMTNDNQVVIFDIIEQTAQQFTQPTNIAPTTFAVADDEWMAVGYWDGKVRLYNIYSKRVLHTFHNYNRPISTIDFSIDGHYLAYGSMTSIFLWNLQNITNGEIYLEKIFEAGEIKALEFNPFIPESMPINRFASISNFMSIQTWDTLAPTQSIDETPFQMAYPRIMSYSPNGFLVAVIGQKTTAPNSCSMNECTLEIINFEKYSPQIGFESIEIGRLGYSNVDFNSDGRLLASASQGGLIEIWGVLID